MLTRGILFGLIDLIALISIFHSRLCAADESCARLEETRAPRGMQCLHCLHPRAPGGVAPFVELLKKTCLKSPALGFVVDGSFGFDEARLLEAVAGLSEGGRTGRIHLYIYNGPAQRRWQAGVFPSFAAISPRAFRRGIIEDATLRQRFTDQISLLHNVLLTAQALDVSISIAPGLEDNLDNRGFIEAMKLSNSALPQGVHAEWIRSPCVRCASGNDARVPHGARLEVHTSTAHFKNRRGVVSNDGEHTRFSFEPRDDRLIPLARLNQSLALADKLQSTYLLWIARYQDSPYGYAPLSPNDRHFRSPTVEEEAEIVEFLRR